VKAAPRLATVGKKKKKKKIATGRCKFAEQLLSFLVFGRLWQLDNGRARERERERELGRAGACCCRSHRASLLPM
jgi:hypothetical protein